MNVNFLKLLNYLLIYSKFQDFRRKRERELNLMKMADEINSSMFIASYILVFKDIDSA